MPYTIAISQQAPMALVIALDLLIALIFPMRYRSISTMPYVALLCLPGWIYSLFFMIYGWIMMNDDLVHLCNVVVGLDFYHLYVNTVPGLEPSVSSLWTSSNVVINFAVLAVYLCIFLTLKCRYNPAAYNEHQRVVRRLTVIVIVFIFSWFLALLGANIFTILNINPKILPYLQSNMIFFGCICFSQNFYVCIWRSLDYRRAFMEQLDILRCRNSCKRSSVAIIPSTAERKTGGWIQ
ncbi:hypothetical protein ANCCAN_05336 [Ancylostoma caninum]|uniref:G-protein coupled receptors family 1 profile domain-containing protein n=1 Tax=Ancylostoma caninum TaxID=29170 RepID=A0A368GVY4_ANCCA|nr:hypothetical protein ANCCAN_05336 [Ancylostoma caninum]